VHFEIIGSNPARLRDFGAVHGVPGDTAARAALSCARRRSLKVQ
jgi:hypothetical protein